MLGELIDSSLVAAFLHAELCMLGRGSCRINVHMYCTFAWAAVRLGSLHLRAQDRTSLVTMRHITSVATKTVDRNQNQVDLKYSLTCTKHMQ